MTVMVFKIVHASCFCFPLHSRVCTAVSATRLVGAEGSDMVLPEAIEAPVGHQRSHLLGHRTGGKDRIHLAALTRALLARHMPLLLSPHHRLQTLRDRNPRRSIRANHHRSKSRGEGTHHRRRLAGTTGRAKETRATSHLQSTGGRGAVANHLAEGTSRAPLIGGGRAQIYAAGGARGKKRRGGRRHGGREGGETDRQPERRGVQEGGRRRRSGGRC